MNINQIQVNPFNVLKPETESIAKSVNTVESSNPSFEDYLKGMLKDVNHTQIEADKQTTLLSTGQVENVHDVTIAGAKAKISLDLTMAVRNKVIEAYKEVMRMQV